MTGMLSLAEIVLLQEIHWDLPWIPRPSGIRATRTVTKEPHAKPIAIHDKRKLCGANPIADTASLIVL